MCTSVESKCCGYAKKYSLHSNSKGRSKNTPKHVQSFWSVNNCAASTTMHKCPCKVVGHEGRAVDGKQRTCTNVMNHVSPSSWWMVDLGKPKQIADVVVYNTVRKQATSYRLDN